MYADYAFYTESFYGSAIAEADFPRLASRASDFLDYYTLGKATRVPEGDTATLTALGKACCAVAEAMQEDDRNKALAAKALTEALTASGGEIKSESVGSHSVSYTTAADYSKTGAAQSQRDMRAAYAEIASVYLAQTGLLYRGGGCGCILHTQ